MPGPAAALKGRRFWKMTGSGNDFVFFDAREGMPPGAEAPETIRALCSRTDGIGADGVVWLETAVAAGADFAIRYYNRDGSRGELCGNASLCSSNLSIALGMAAPSGLAFLTDVGAIAARVTSGLPEIDLNPVQGLRADAGIALATGEQRIGFANTGVPHLVVLVADAEAVDLPPRGRELRFHPAVLPAGANVNFVSAAGSRWRMRTYERGVEGETLACGTGSVATAALLVVWGLAAPGEVEIVTTSGRSLVPTIPSAGRKPSLRGEGRVVFEGVVGDI
jgi:diaminopimelate epimerase